MAVLCLFSSEGVLRQSLLLTGSLLLFHILAFAAIALFCAGQSCAKAFAILADATVDKGFQKVLWQT